MKVVKPGKLSLLTRCFEHQRRFHMGVSVMAFVPLTGTPDLLSEIALWTFIPERLGKEPVLDGGVPKARSEFLVHGSAFAPQGQPTPALAVRAQVGPCSKTLHVYGDRYWRGVGASEPRPFTVMPLTWAQAFGGPDFPRNPLGKGHAEVEIEGAMIQPLANVEGPDRLVDSPRQRPEPACFLPIDISWPQRSALAGTYDGHWLEHLFPGLAADVDWGIFNLAAPDQQREGPWAVGERFRFDNLHPQKPVLEGQLPPFVARAFVNRRLGDPPRSDQPQQEVRERFQEVPLTLQTLWFFPDAERAVMIFQGSLPIREEDGADVLQILCAAERAGSPRSLDDYRQALADRVPRSIDAALAWLRESDLLPEDLPTGQDPLQAEEAELGKHEGLMQQNMHNKAVREAERARAIVASCGLDPDLHGPLIPEPPTPPPSAAELPALAAKIQAEAEAKAVEERAWFAERLEVAKNTVDELAIPGFTGATLQAETEEPPRGPPTFTAAGQLLAMKAMSADFRSRGIVVDEIEEMIVDKDLYASWEHSEQQMREGYRRTAHLQAPAPALSEEMSAAARERVRLAIARGEDFAALNLTGADLSGMELRGADLRGAFLESARLDGADLRQAKLGRAVLAHASLRGTLLEHADLQDANLGKAVLAQARLDDANLGEAVLAEADLQGATLRRANLAKADLSLARFAGVDGSELIAEELVLIKANLAGVCLRGAKLAKASLLEVDLRGADLSQATLDGATFLTCKAAGADFSQASLVNARFVEGCDLGQAKFVAAIAPRCYLRGSKLTGADFSQATLDGADLSECDLAGARFYRAVAREAKFEKADLRDASMLAANLMSASFSRALIYGLDLRSSNLYAADMARVRSDERVQLTDALLTKVRVNPRYEPQPDEDAP